MSPLIYENQPSPIFIRYCPPLSRAYYLWGAWVVPCSLYETRYYTGMSPPRFPVPAIPYEVDFGQTGVYEGVVYIQNPNTPDDWDFAWDGWAHRRIK
jgi:hypothetical protein